MRQERLTQAQGRELLLQAAVSIVSEAGGPDFSVREVANRAGVNHGLVHRYFGTKDTLILAVIEELTAALADEIRDPRTERGAFGDARRNQTLSLCLAHRRLSDVIDSDRIDGIAAVARALMGNGYSAEDACLRLATLLGWSLNERYLVPAVGLEEEQVNALAQSVAAPPGPLSTYSQPTHSQPG